MDSPLTRAQQYMILCTGPRVERLVLPLIIEQACQKDQPLHEFFTKATNTFEFNRVAESPFFDDDTGDIKRWTGIINRWNQLSPGAYSIIAEIDCYDVDWTWIGNIEVDTFERLPLEWFTSLAQYLEREQLSITVVPPPSNSNADTRERWRLWMQQYELLAHRVQQLPHKFNHRFPELQAE